MNCVMLNCSCESLHALYFYVNNLRVNNSEAVALSAMGWACPYQPFILWHTRFFSKYCYTEMYSFGAVNRIKLPYSVNCCQKLMSKHLSWKRSQFIVNSITRRGCLIFLYKTWCRVLVSIWIFEYFPGRVFQCTFFHRIPALVTCQQQAVVYALPISIIVYDLEWPLKDILSFSI